jgi:hypothetical protein
MAKDFKKYDVKSANNFALGQGGTVVETGTTALTGLNVYAIQMLADTVFSTLTDAGASGDAMTGFTMLAGTIIYGEFTAITLTSGKIRAYTGTASPT